MKTGHRIDSPVHENNKPLQNKDLLEIRNIAYKPAYKQKRKNAPNEGQKQFGQASPATMTKMYTIISFEDMQNGVTKRYLAY